MLSEIESDLGLSLICSNKEICVDLRHRSNWIVIPSETNDMQGDVEFKGLFKSYTNRSNVSTLVRQSLFGRKYIPL